MSQIDRIYAPWDGNAEAMAADIGEKAVTVRQWRRRGNIPAKYWPRIISSAQQRGSPIDLQDFLPTETWLEAATPADDRRVA